MLCVKGKMVGETGERASRCRWEKNNRAKRFRAIHVLIVIAILSAKIHLDIFSLGATKPLRNSWQIEMCTYLNVVCNNLTIFLEFLKEK